MPNESHQDWEELFDQLPVETAADDEQQATAKARALNAFENRPTPNSRLQAIGNTLMKYKVPHWTTAALLVAGMIWLFQSSSTPAFAFDALVANLMEARTARYDMTTTVQGQPPIKAKAFYLEPNHLRQELSTGYVNIADWSTGKMIGLDSVNKQATVINMVKIPKQPKNVMPMNQFTVIRDALREATAGGSENVKLLGKKRIDGREVVGFHFDVPAMPLTVWADTETELPVRIESTMAGPPQTKVVMSNYEFNVELDESLFSLEVPDGYTILEAKVDASPATEDDLIASLRMVCKITDGDFPDGMDQVAVGKYAGKYVAKMGIDKKKGPTSEHFKEIIKLSRGFQYMFTLPKEADAHYAGVGVKLGDTDRPIMWYKPTDSEKYRVIYGDLTVKELDAAPKVDGAMKLSR